jgi:NAD(P)-dependent dehydrogenase (short-subunit alcohol dehydrogenase family)
MGYKFPEELNFLNNINAEQKISDGSLKDKLCIISGSTSGVGYQALKRFAQAGAKLVMISRNKEKAIRIKNEIIDQYDVEIDIVIADFSKLDDVRNAAEIILRDYPKIDVFVNSAGLYSTKAIHTSEGFELVYCVNHLAPFLMVNLLAERFRESGHARIILVNSQGHRFNGLNPKDLNWDKRPYMGLRGYGASKTAELLTLLKFKEIFRLTDVTINAMHPGDVKTNIGNNNGLIYNWFLHHVTWHFLKESDISGEALYYLASSSELNNISGRFFNLTIDEIPAKHARDKKMAEVIWKHSMQMTGLAKLDKEK